jgi:two-component system, OmpR family, response regulator RpaB
LAASRTVLVIDDDAYIRRVVQLKLKIHGYEVLTARDGEEGFTLIKTRQPDVVVSDINMPKIDGRTLCKLTNALKQKRPFLTIIMTARISPDERDWIEAMTDTQFMEKPFSPARLIKDINRYFGIDEK